MLTEDKKHIVHDWIEKYSDTFYGYLCNRVNDKNTAKDILQETFIAAWKNSKGFKRESSEKTWLFSILKNKLIDHFRQNVKAQFIDSSDLFFDEVDHWAEKAAPKEWSPAEDLIHNKEFHLVLQKCRSKLTPLQQQTFAMKYLDDLDAELICKILKITASNYWVLIHRSKLELQSCLTKNWFFKQKAKS